MEGKRFICIDLRVCLYHGKEYVAETSGQMWHKLTSDTTSDQDCAKAQEHFAVLCWPSIMHWAGRWSPVFCTDVFRRHTQTTFHCLKATTDEDIKPDF